MESVQKMHFSNPSPVTCMQGDPFDTSDDIHSVVFHICEHAMHKTARK
jgi:hypothetical protein